MRNFKRKQRKQNDKLHIGTYAWDKLSNGDFLLYGEPTVQLRANEFAQFRNQLEIDQTKGKIKYLTFYENCCFFIIND